MCIVDYRLDPAIYDLHPAVDTVNLTQHLLRYAGLDAEVDDASECGERVVYIEGAAEPCHCLEDQPILSVTEGGFAE